MFRGFLERNPKLQTWATIYESWLGSVSPASSMLCLNLEEYDDVHFTVKTEYKRMFGV